jgi:hypothetical protein
MSNLGEARYQLERLMRAHLHGEIETQTFRNLTYAFSVMLSYFKEEIGKAEGAEFDESLKRFARIQEQVFGLKEGVIQDGLE